MSVETELRAALIADATFAALCDTRVYAHLMPQNATLPAVVYTRVDTERTSAMGVDVTPTMARIQFACFAVAASGVSGYDKAVEVADAVRAVVQRRRAGSVQDAFVELEFDAYEHDTLRHSRIIDFRVWFNEA